VLPPRMEFRPMVEMTPRHLESQIQLEHEEEKVVAEVTGESEISTGPIADYSSRLVERMERDRLAIAPGNLPNLAETVDPLSLSSLLAHGFEEGAARRALKCTGNDTQAALEFLLNPPTVSGGVVVPGEDGSDAIVRMPATLARIQRLKEVKKRIQERKNEKEKREPEPKDLLDLSPSRAAVFAEQPTPLPLIDWQ